jgi:hypothetical protein
MKRRLVLPLVLVLLTAAACELLGPDEEATRVAEENATLRAQVGSLEEREKALSGTATTGAGAAIGTAEAAAASATAEASKYHLTASGTLRTDDGKDIPEDARVVVFWLVVTEPSYVYVFGHGTVDAQASTFEVVFDKEPPEEALNWFQGDALGVGMLLLTTDRSLESGILPSDYDPDIDDWIGGAGQHAIIYIQGDLDLDEGDIGFAEDAGIEWLYEFSEGYSVGKGTEIPGARYEGFTPVDPSSIEITVDELGNIEFVDWS